MLSDSAEVAEGGGWGGGGWLVGGALPHLGEETLAGCEMLLNKVTPRVIVGDLSPVSLPVKRRIYSPGPRVIHMENIVSEFILCLRWESDLRLCLPLREVVVNLQTTMSRFEKGKKNTSEPISARTPFSYTVFLLQLKLPTARKSRNKSLIAQEFFH